MNIRNHFNKLIRKFFEVREGRAALDSLQVASWRREIRRGTGPSTALPRRRKGRLAAADCSSDR